MYKIMIYNRNFGLEQNSSILKNNATKTPNDTDIGIMGNSIKISCSAELGEPDYRLALLSVTLFLLAASAVGFNLVLLSLLRHTKIFHPNVRLLLVNAETGTILAAGCLIFRSTFYHLSLIFRGYEMLALHSGMCALLECLYVIGVVVMLLSLAGIGLERWCTTRPRCHSSNASSLSRDTKSQIAGSHCANNDPQASAPMNPASTSGVGSKRRMTLKALRRRAVENLTDQQQQQTGAEKVGPLVKVYTSVAWIVGVCNVAVFYWSAALFDKTLCYCHIALAAGDQALYGCLASWLALAVFTLLIYSMVLRRNRRQLLDFTINTARHNLQERFAAWHNVTITTMLMPAVITNAVLSAAFSSALMPVYGWYNNDVRRVVTRGNILALLGVLHILAASMLLHPILTIRMCEKLRFVACARYPKLRRLWGVGPSSSGKFSTASMRGIAISEPRRISTTATAEDAASMELAETSIGGGGSRKKPSDSIIVDYRIDPDQHRQLVERLWSAK